MSIAPFSLPGEFRKGNLHTHSNVSDGCLTPQSVCELYRDAGYDFLSLTDHFMERYGYPVTDTTGYRTSSFTTILGAELHTGATELGHLWHILAVGLPAGFGHNLPGETGPQIAQRALDAGAFVSVAHPAWYGLSEADVVSLGDVHSIEIFNSTSADYNDKPDSCYMLDLMLMRGRKYTAIATDDAHFKEERHDALRGWVNVKAQLNDPQELLDALKAGAFYSSTGPTIYDISIEGDSLRVHCSPAERIFLTGYGPKALHTHGHGVRHAEFRISDFRDTPFLRVTVRDSRGGRAWSNPIWL